VEVLGKVIRVHLVAVDSAWGIDMVAIDMAGTVDTVTAASAEIAAERAAMVHVVPLRTAPRDSLVHVHRGTALNAASYG
jgi:hypothetical protein